MTKKITIKSLIIASLVLLGAATIILSLVTATSFQNTAIDSQTQTLSRILEVAAGEKIKNVNKIAGELANDSTASSEFRSAFNKALKENSTNEVVGFLNQQFHQRYVTGGLLKLAAIKIYDTKFKLIASSTDGGNKLPSAIPEQIMRQAKDRKGAERLKKLGELWQIDNKVYYSVLAPIGGIFLKGYVEVVVQPEHNLYEINRMIQSPFKITTMNNQVLSQTDNWTDDLDNSLLIHYVVKDTSGEPALNLYAIENAEQLFSSINQARIFVIASYTVLMVLSIAIILLLLTRYFFKPLNSLMVSMEQCATGDLMVDTKFSGLSDIEKVSSSFTTLVDGLLNQIRSVITCSDTVKESSDEVHTVSNRTNQNIERQQVEISQVATAINEMSSTVQEVANSATQAASSAQQADIQAKNGAETVTKSISSIQSLSAEVSNAASVIEQVKGSSTEIGGVLDVIKTIAEQTNLLALNAAIEAARAGEQGRGFAVVADEVRTLASRTQKSTEEIEQMIASLQSNADNAVQVMLKNTELAGETVDFANSAGEALKEITLSIETIHQMNEQIATAAEEQTHVAEEINRSVVNINDIAQDTVADSNQTAQSSVKLSGLAVELKSLTARFKV